MVIKTMSDMVGAGAASPPVIDEGKVVENSTETDGINKEVIDFKTVYVNLSIMTTLN